MRRDDRAKMAQQTVEILAAGFYTAPSGERVDLSPALQRSLQETRIIRPDEWPALHDRAQLPATGRTSIEVTGETTLAALHRLVVEQGRARVTALNFASAKNPGGGFLGGSQAQEESLARSSALYASLTAAPDYYDANRKCGTPLYTDHAIFSPDVPVFRDDAGTLLNRPYAASFITMPAVNAGAIPAGSPDVARIAEVMERRIRCVLALAAANGSRELVLGAWGCGVFRNDPAMIAGLFDQVLGNEERWHASFDRIVFAVFDPSPDGVNLRPFKERFAPEGE